VKLLALALAAVSAAGQVFAACAPDVVDIRDNGSSIRFQVEVADDNEERAVGLMHRESMPEFSGMLFVFERPQPVSFWMKNTLIPLDMLFIDETGTVKRIARETTPLSLESVPGGPGILLVLEINGGMSDALGLGEGAEIRHPSLDPASAVWPCEAG
jgi:uncharacterized membrane protein (UPF0127 family)